MKVNFIDDDIPVNATIPLKNLMKIDEIFTEVGADWTAYSSAAYLHKEIKTAIEEALKRLNWKAEYLQSSFDSVIEYKVTKEKAKEDA